MRKAARKGGAASPTAQQRLARASDLGRAGSTATLTLCDETDGSGARARRAARRGAPLARQPAVSLWAHAARPSDGDDGRDGRGHAERGETEGETLAETERRRRRRPRRAWWARREGHAAAARRRRFRAPAPPGTDAPSSPPVPRRLIRSRSRASRGRRRERGASGREHSGRRRRRHSSLAAQRRLVAGSPASPTRCLLPFGPRLVLRCAAAAARQGDLS